MKEKKAFYISMLDFGMFLAAAGASYVSNYEIHLVGCDLSWDGFLFLANSKAQYWSSDLKKASSCYIVFHLFSLTHLKLMPNAMHKCEPGQGPLVRKREGETMG